MGLDLVYASGTKTVEKKRMQNRFAKQVLALGVALNGIPNFVLPFHGTLGKCTCKSWNIPGI